MLGDSQVCQEIELFEKSIDVDVHSVIIWFVELWIHVCFSRKSNKETSTNVDAELSNVWITE